MALRVDDFKSKLSGGGARANLFRCIINNPNVAAGLNTELASFMCKGGSLPPSILSSIGVPFRGRQLKVAGDRTFENWTATIFNEDSFALRNAFEVWMNSINAHSSNTSASTNPSDYQVQILVEQLNRKEEVIKSYTIEGAFPVNVSEIVLSYDSNDAIEEFTVEFAYQYWQSNTTS